MNDAFAMRPNANHNLQQMERARPSAALALVTLVNSVSTALDFDVQTPLLIPCDDGRHPAIRAPAREQMGSHLLTSPAFR